MSAPPSASGSPDPPLPPRPLGVRLASRVAGVPLARRPAGPLAGFAFAATLGLPSLAGAQAPPGPRGESPADLRPRDPGFDIGFRAGPSFVAGDAERGAPLAGKVGAPPALVVDLGYRFGDRLYAGGLLAGGFGLVDSSPCPDGYRCKNAALGAFGGVLRYRLPPLGRLEPWFGGGVAFVVQADRASRTEIEGGGGFCLFSCGPRRIEYVRNTTRYGPAAVAEGGLLFRLSRRVGVGVAVSAFVGDYLGAKTTETRNRDQIDSDARGIDARPHLWALAAAHLTFNFGSPGPPPPRPAPPPPAGR